MKRKNQVREFGPTSQGIWSPKTLNLVPLFLGRIPLLEMLGSAARSIFLTKKGPPGDQIPCLQHIYIYIYIYISVSVSLFLYLSPSPLVSLCFLLLLLLVLLLLLLFFLPPPLLFLVSSYCYYLHYYLLFSVLFLARIRSISHHNAADQVPEQVKTRKQLLTAPSMLPARYVDGRARAY